MSTEKNWIDDGYNLSATIKPIPGLHTGIEFEYRPATLEDRLKAVSLGDKPEEQAKFLYELVAKKVVSIGGMASSFNAADLRHYRASLVSRMADIILEYSVSDEAIADRKN
jgi:hypothetical protein